jgi:ActR/RegA family two-component response regulator
MLEDSCWDDIKNIATYESRQAGPMCKFLLIDGIESYYKKHPDRRPQKENFFELDSGSFNEALEKHFKNYESFGKYILCIEDDERALTLLGHVVLRSGFTPLLANSSDLSLYYTQLPRIHGVIIDYHLRHFEINKAHELMKELLDHKPDLDYVVITGDERDLIKETFNPLKKQPTAYIQKREGLGSLAAWLHDLKGEEK